MKILGKLSMWTLVLAGLLAFGCSDNGADGKDGMDGDAGPQGEQGEQGEQGAKGDPGAPGAKGDQGDPGADGISCWDLNSNNACDAADEDINGDGECTVADCAGTGGGTDGQNGTDGANGSDGLNGADGADGINCWDLDENGVCDLDSEDINMDGVCSVLDCRGEDATATEPANEPWANGYPISQRVHAVHHGSALYYPNSTVGHADGIPGRNWDIEYPMDIRNCESCHNDGTTSGSWETNPSRIPCMGCHDSEAAQAHFALNTVDPTPNAPWSGDEQESCAACHGSEATGLGITEFHGEKMLMSTGEYAACPAGVTSRCGKYKADIEITDANADDPAAVSVDFSVTDMEGDPISGITAFSFNISKLVQDGAFTSWVPYIYSTATVSEAGDWPNPIGTTNDNGNRESDGTLTDNGDGTYHYVFATDISAVTANGAAVTYDAGLTHRIAIFTGGHQGPTDSAVYDFVPDGTTANALTRDIVQTTPCLQCHGANEFHGHGGDRLIVEDCVTCHNPSGMDVESGNSIDMKVMIHKIHAGSELASIAGPDGIVWDDPSTAVDESADNGSYIIWGHNNSEATWWDVGFPAVTDNCTKCHTGSGVDVDNWKTVPSRAACGSCHDTVNFATGEGHGNDTTPGGPQTSDTTCTSCHAASGVSLGGSVELVHDFTVADPRNIPEFDVEVKVSTPANGQYFVAGETPVVSVVLSKDGTPIDHTTVVEDDEIEGCTAEEAASNSCPAPDGKFASAILYVTGPRAHRNPVLTTAARAKVMGVAGPYDLSADGASLTVVLDGGKNLVVFDRTGGDSVASATVTVDVADGTFADVAAATAAEVVDWLNGDSAFAARAIAYLEDGMPAIRSRNLGDTYSVQLKAGAVTSAVFDGDTDVHRLKGYTSSNNIMQSIDPADDDPKASFSTGAITYTLDPVDDLQPGTYIASVQIADRGRISATDYCTPTVGWVGFQVGQADEELPVARSCNSCHQNDQGKGYVLDYPRHNKLFGDDAVDQCAACHDYQNGQR